ncbi:MAG: VOC family protein [Coriobacteriia bacterium]|nr:VOC family protein [Coriobacteriia bacterium]MCL2870885.1 VOC family protein [Coriobacteriia bacterium]
MKMTIMLFFQGNCREAMDFYGKAFNTSPEFILTYGEAPADPDRPLPEDFADKVIHARMDMADLQVLFSDGYPGWEAEYGNNMSMTVNTGTVEEAQSIFDNLQEGATVYMPLDKTFFAEAYGMLTDKFGVMWNIASSSELASGSN